MDEKLTKQCLQTLGGLPSSSGEAHATLLELVGTTISKLSSVSEQLAVLEAARSPVALVQASMAARYASHPLPPNSEENQTFLNVVELWRSMADAYMRLLSVSIGHPGITTSRALLWQRRMHYASLTLLEYFRAHRMIPQGLWAQLHDSYSAAVQQEVASERVDDPLNAAWRLQSARECFIATLLVDLANPFGRDAREFDWINRWAERFAPTCDLRPAAESMQDRLDNPIMYALDLSSDHGLRPLGKLHDTRHGRILHFDGSQLAAQIRTVLTQIKRGGVPPGLGLGRDAPAEPVAQLLLSLYRPWGLTTAGRRYRRRRFAGEAKLLSHWDSIAAHLTDGPRKSYALRSQYYLPEISGGEPWQITDQSVGGFKLNKHSPLQRLAYRQLVGIHPPDGIHYLLGMVSWLMYRHNGVLESGIALMSGTPNRVAVRSGNQRSRPGTEHAYDVAFFLPALASMKQPASLIVPSGRYHPQQTLESHPGQPQLPRHLRLTGLLASGSNFDQLAFEPLNAPVA